jgi:Tfp pilus assembly protein PilE
MAILAAALAPSLIKYINKSRLSTDVTTGTTIATAVNSALAVEKAYDSASSYDSVTTAVNSIIADNNSFSQELAAVLGINAGTGTIKGKSKKDLAGDAIANQEFYVLIDQKNNKVSVWYGSTDDAHLVSPNPGASMAE